MAADAANEGVLSVRLTRLRAELGDGFRLSYESAARSAEVLGLDVGDLVLEAERGRVRRKAGAIDTN